MDKEFWKRVDKLQIEHNKSTRELALEIGVSYDVIRQQKYREQSPKAEVIIDIAECLHTTTDYLLLGKTTQLYSTEARYVEDHPEARALVSQIMEDPALLQALAAVIASCKKPINTKYTG